MHNFVSCMQSSADAGVTNSFDSGLTLTYHLEQHKEGISAGKRTNEYFSKSKYLQFKLPEVFTQNKTKCNDFCLVRSPH